MERLTKRNQFGEVTVSGKDDDDIIRKYHEIANRLAELEDKLESGRLMELLCKVGDIIFVPYIYKEVSAIMQLPVDEIQIAKYSVTYCTDFETDDEEFAIKFSHGLFLSGTHGCIWFTDKAQAEARLKELKEVL